MGNMKVRRGNAGNEKVQAGIEAEGRGDKGTRTDSKVPRVKKSHTETHYFGIVILKVVFKISAPELSTLF